MFKRVRNRILVLNMAMVSAVVIIAFAVIFATTYTREQNENQEKLINSDISITNIPGVTLARQGAYYFAPEEVQDREFFASGFARRISPDSGLSFSLLVDAAGNVIDINSMVDLPEDTYALAASEAINTNKSSIVLEDRIWQFATSPISVVVSGTYDSAFVVTGEYQNIRFLDITDSIKMLNALALTLAGVMVAILALIFFISRVFANRAVLPMEEAWDKQSRFVADASHELKTPLTIIGANCGALYANGEETVESQKRWVDSIMRASDRMTGLIANLLDLARMEGKETQLQSLLFDLSVILEETLDEMEPAAEKKGIRIEKNIAPNINLESDKEHVSQLLSILLDNAVKYTDCGGEISASLRNEKRHIIFELRNTGEGISKEHLHRLFDRFYRVDPARSSENGGYGLGLSIAKSIADRLDIELTADSKAGEYTVFSVIFKLKS